MSSMNSTPSTPATPYTLADYKGLKPRWCSGCGDHAVLSSVLKVCQTEQLPPEQTVVVSGIGCSSRFPHYMSTYGFHGLHGRAFPIACGVRSRRPDLHIFVATGDGDCLSIGASHWLHAIRYNMKMTVILFDNNIYGLTKKQTSPTSAKGLASNTHPEGNLIDPLDPLAVTLGITNVSFVAQTVDWLPGHLTDTLLAAHRHPGFSFVRVLQRCPHFTADVFEGCRRDPTLLTLLVHPQGIPADERTLEKLSNQVTHNPANLAEARALTQDTTHYPVGLLYHNPNADRYDLSSAQGANLSTHERIDVVQKEIDRFLI